MMKKVSACLSLSFTHKDTHTHLTLRAGKRLLARVDPLVELQLILVLEALGAELANARRALLIRINRRQATRRQ